VSIRRLNASELGEIEPLIRDYPYRPYRNYRVYSRRVQTAILRAEIESALSASNGVVFYAEGASPAGLVLRRLQWDSQFFGVPMARIEYLLRTRERDRAGLDQVLSACAETCRAEGIWHVTVRLDVADTLAIVVLEDHGYRLMDALVTYIQRPKDDPPRAVREVGTIRPFRPEDADELLAITCDSYRGFRGRFHLDPHLPDERCDALYLEWARQCCTGRMADEVLVSEGAGGELYGFLAFRRREPTSSVGNVAIYGSGLGASRRDTPGAYAGLLRAGMSWAYERGGVAEGQTQNYNFPTVRLYEAVGGKYVRADYTFHGWFGPARPT
jgi:hypothetical protein